MPWESPNTTSSFRHSRVMLMMPRIQHLGGEDWLGIVVKIFILHFPERFPLSSVKRYMS